MSQDHKKGVVKCDGEVGMYRKIEGREGYFEIEARICAKALK